MATWYPIVWVCCYFLCQLGTLSVCQYKSSMVRERVLTKSLRAVSQFLIPRLSSFDLAVSLKSHMTGKSSAALAPSRG